MDREEGDMSRAGRVDSLMAAGVFERLADSVDLTRYYFADGISENADDLSREKTALGEAIYELQQEQIVRPADEWLLLSDGNSNAGREPASVVRGFKTPIVTVDMAQDVGNFDVRLAEVDFNPVTFVGQPTEIQARIGWHNAANRDVILELRSKGRPLTQERFSIDEESGLGDIILEYVPAEPGQQLLEVAIVPMDGEETTDNNSRTFSQKVLKSRLLVLMVSRQPDYEVGFLKRFFDASDKYDVDLVVTDNKAGNLSGSFPQRQEELNRYDLVILHDPDPARLDARKDIIKSYLADRGGAIWVMMGKDFANRGPIDWFDALLPFFQDRRRDLAYLEFTAEPAEGNLFHPAIRLADDRAAIRQTWSEQPPFETLVPCNVEDPDGTVLAYSPPLLGVTKWPVLGYKRTGPGKLVASAATPFWPWKFVNAGLGNDPDVYNRFVEGVTSWLTITDDVDPIRVVPEKRVFTRGEEVRFDGFAFDLGFRPIPDVTGSVTLRPESQDEESYEADLLETGEGTYEAVFKQLPPGTYRYEAMMEKGGQELKRTTGRIQVETFSLEEFDQSGDPTTLRAIARLSGGSYHAFQDFDDAVRSIPLTPIAESEHGELVLFNQFWLLILFIGALSVEWMVRKLNHLL
jgi:hypothetical protein